MTTLELRGNSFTAENITDLDALRFAAMLLTDKEKRGGMESGMKEFSAYMGSLPEESAQKLFGERVVMCLMDHKTESAIAKNLIAIFPALENHPELVRYENGDGYVRLDTEEAVRAIVPILNKLNELNETQQGKQAPSKENNRQLATVGFNGNGDRPRRRQR